jgi:hypothetical protein
MEIPTVYQAPTMLLFSSSWSLFSFYSQLLQCGPTQPYRMQALSLSLRPWFLPSALHMDVFPLETQLVPLS